MPPGWRDAVHGSQQTFRRLLDAMSRPGRVQRLAGVCTDGLGPAAAVAGAPGSGMFALLLTLLDAHTSAHLGGRWARPDVHDYLRFHTGVAGDGAVAAAAYVAVPGAGLEPALWQQLELGSDEEPQRGATLLLEVDVLGTEAPTRLSLRGPGIDGRQELSVGGVPGALWRWRAQLRPMLPRGFDLVLVCGDRLAALPRTTQLDWDD
jgi:alpha-D-ribose 1-methylphosphonate 5-triphosphate synthase subunit PhnH